MILVLIRQFLMILWKFEKVFFLPKKIIFFKKSIFFSKTSIMEDLYIDVETWILHQFRRLYPQNFRFYTFFLNFMNKIDFVCFSDFYGIIYIHNIQKMMSYIYVAKYSWEIDKLKFFLWKHKPQNIIWKFDGTIIEMEHIEQKLC